MDITKEVFQPRRRGEQRDEVLIAAAIFGGTFDAPIEVDATDLSPGGVFVLSDLLLQPGERLLVSFVVPGTWHRILVDAQVARAAHRGRAGMGLEFVRLAGADDKILRAALGRWRAATSDALVRDGGYRC